MILEASKDAMNKLRKFGRQLGFRFTEKPIEEKLAGPNNHLNYLAHTQGVTLGLPTLSDVTKDCTGLTDKDRDMINKNMQVIMQQLQVDRDKVANTVTDMFDTAANYVNKVDALTFLYLQMYGHADVSQRELLRTKLASLLQPHLRDEVLGDHVSRYLN